MSNVLRHLSLQKKLIAAMGAALLLFVLVSSVLSVWLMGQTLRERVERHELPAVVNAIRNDVQHHIGEPLARAQSMASNQYLLDWEAGGLAEDGLPAWQRYAARLKQDSRAAAIFWVSASTGRYFNEQGQVRQLQRGAEADRWFYEFVDSGKPYTLDIDRNNETGTFMLFINTRFDAGNGQVGVTGPGAGRRQPDRAHAQLPSGPVGRSVSGAA